MARPTSYKPDYARQAKVMCERGGTDEDLAQLFGVSARTIIRWQADFPEFCHAIKVGKDVSDDRVERSLYHKAIGYTFDSEKVFQHQGEIVRAPVKEHVAPDTTACIFWLKNRRKAEWRDRQEVTGADGGPIKFELADMSEAELAAIAGGR